MIKIYNRLQDSWKGVEYLVFCWSPKERDEAISQMRKKYNWIVEKKLEHDNFLWFKLYSFVFRNVSPRDAW